MTEAIDCVALGNDLTAEQATAALDQIMQGLVGDAETAAFLIGLRTKGETATEIAGLARAMRAHATPVHATHTHLLDTAGTGGGVPTFNVSTTAAFVAAGAGCAVAKHGNRSSTGLSGSADVLEALGAEVVLAPELVAELIDEVGFGFMFAPSYHSAMKHVMPVRKALAVRTVFNFLGPLTNPAGAARQLIGVADESLIEVVASALAELGVERGLVVRGAEGLDELSASGPSIIYEVNGSTVTRSEVVPADLGLEAVDPSNFSAASPERNAEITRNVLGGASGPERTLTVANAAAAIYAGGAADSLNEAARVAEGSIDSGAALGKLDQFVSRTKESKGPQ